MCKSGNGPSVKGREEVKSLPALWHTRSLVLPRTVCGDGTSQESCPARREEQFWIWISVTDTSLATAAFPSGCWFVETKMFCEESSNSASLSQNTGSHSRELGPSGRFLPKPCAHSCQRAGNPAQQVLQFEDIHLWAGTGLTQDGNLFDTSGSSISCQIELLARHLAAGDCCLCSGAVPHGWALWAGDPHPVACQPGSQEAEKVGLGSGEL